MITLTHFSNIIKLVLFYFEFINYINWDCRSINVFWYNKQAYLLWIFIPFIRDGFQEPGTLAKHFMPTTSRTFVAIYMLPF